MSDLLEVQLQVAVGYPIGVLGTKLGPLQESRGQIS